MGRSQAEKAHSHERILARAAAQIREAGLESLSVGGLMRSVELTHGGFYGHFDSRSDLLVHALARALEDGEAAAAGDPAKPPSYAAIVRRYLSRAHRDSREQGCAIAALAADVARADGPARAVMEEHVDRLISNIGRAMGTDDEDQAMFALSAMLGGLLLSRVMVDQKRSDALLRVVRDQLIALNDGSSQ